MFKRIRATIREFRGVGAGDPYTWRRGRLVLIDLPVDERAARQWLPPVLRLSTPPRVSVFFGYYPETSFGSAYHEAAVFLQVRLFGLFPVNHCPWMLVDDDTALILGREMLGYPKKMGTIEMSEQDGVLTASASRDGVELMSVRATIAGEAPGAAPAVGGWMVNMRGLINVALPGHLLAFRFRERVHACNDLRDCEVKLQSSEKDPIAIASSTKTVGQPTIRTCDLGLGRLPLVARVWLVSPTRIAALMRLRAR